MNITKYKEFLKKKGFNLDGPVVRKMIEPLREFIKKEGNPVPSIDKIKKEILNVFKEELSDIFTDKAIENIVNYSFERLQNGVETNKEQPNKPKICNYPKCGCGYFKC
jgi:hypothetical protein